ncbi:MAG TPA: prolyl oligopeptidase family serine peptidase [Tepidisphaeraceae bacterium]|nr:prolyl oligopeptidase family serine peptidase [Tepidisphaeraceae bacterium]
MHIPVRYLLYVPPGYRADPMDAKSGDGHGWPLVLFLHGAGERGDDIEMVKTHGPPKLVAQGMRLPFILVSPQCPKDEWWDPQLLTPLLDEIQRTYKVDPDRVYLTGLSMGGFGTWDMARRHPSRFAAIVPICGGSEPSLVSLFPALKMLPVWAFHGADDKTVPPSRSEEMINALHKLGNSQAGLTIYPGVGHDSWTRTYENPHVYEWMLDQKRGGGSQ